MSQAPSAVGPPARRQRTLLGFLKMSNLTRHSLSEAQDEALVRPKTMHVACITVVLLVALPLIGTLIGAYLYVLLAWAAFLPGEVVNICSRKEEKEGRTGILIALEC